MVRKIRKGKPTKANSCDGKVPHESEGAAYAHARYLGSAMHPYSCKFCAFWHIGHGRKR